MNSSYHAETQPEHIEPSLFAQALAATVCGVVITDALQATNPIVYVNSAVCELTGYEKEEFIGRNCRFLQGDDRNQPGVAAIRHACEQRLPCTVVLRNYKKNGTLFYNELTITPLINKDGAVSHFVGVQKDVTTEIQLKQQRETFVATLIHDLKNPLIGTSRLMEHLLRGTTPTAQTNQILETILAGNDAMLRLIRDAIDCYREEDGALTVVLADIDINQVIRSCASALSPMAEPKNIHVALGNNVVRLRADEGLCRRAFTNLIENAIKHSPPGGTVDVAVLQHPGSVSVEISNAGNSIPLALQQTLFTKFATGDRSTGSGLGLFLSKMIMQNHGGSLEFKSSDRLTTFIADFPKALAS